MQCKYAAAVRGGLVMALATMSITASAQTTQPVARRPSLAAPAPPLHVAPLGWRAPALDAPALPLTSPAGVRPPVVSGPLPIASPPATFRPPSLSAPAPPLTTGGPAGQFQASGPIDTERPPPGW
jgi:hypothetical protein